MESQIKENKGCYWCSHFVQPEYDSPVWCNAVLGEDIEYIDAVSGRCKIANIIRYEYAKYNKDLTCPYWDDKFKDLDCGRGPV